MRRLVRRLWYRLTTPCRVWPCRRCERAGRSSWRERQRWHQGRRDVAASLALGAATAAAIVATWLIALAVTR